MKSYSSFYSESYFLCIYLFIFCGVISRFNPLKVRTSQVYFQVPKFISKKETSVFPILVFKYFEGFVGWHHKDQGRERV